MKMFELNIQTDQNRWNSGIKWLQNYVVESSQRGFLRSRSFVMITKLHRSDSIMFAQHFERFDFVTQLAGNGIPLIEGQYMYVQLKHFHVCTNQN